MRFRRGIAVAGHPRQDHPTTSLPAVRRRRPGSDLRDWRQISPPGPKPSREPGLVAEPTRANGSFLSLKPLMAVINNIDSTRENYDNVSPRSGPFAEFLQRLRATVGGARHRILKSLRWRGTPPPRDELWLCREPTCEPRTRQKVDACAHLAPAQDTRQVTRPCGRHNVQTRWPPPHRLVLGGPPGHRQRAEKFPASAVASTNWADHHDNGRACNGRRYGHHPASAAVFAQRAGLPEKPGRAFQPHRTPHPRPVRCVPAGLSEVDVLVLSYPARRRSADCRAYAKYWARHPCSGAMKNRGQPGIRTGRGCRTCARKATCCC